MIKYINYKNLEVYWIKKRGMKNVYLQIKDKTVYIKSNYYFTKKQALNLLSLKINWIKKHLDENERKWYFLGKVTDNPSKITKNHIETLMRGYIEHLKLKYELIPNKITYKYTKSIWGSCSYKNNISLNINLLQTPKDCIEYVVVHEMVHLKIKNHSSKFWKEVGKILPDYKQRRSLLKSYEKKILKVTNRSNLSK